MTDILNIKKHQKAQEKLEEAEYKQLKLDVVRTFSSPEGLRVLNFLLAMSEIYSSTFTGDEMTYFFEGRRSVGLEILDVVLDADQEIYIKILRGVENAR